MAEAEMSESKRFSIVFFFLILFLYFAAPLQLLLASEKGPGKLIEDTISLREKIKKIEEFVHKQMENGKIPGMSVAIVERDNTLYKKGFGFTNVKTKRPVSTKTLFEIGATSKAFTALGILLLEAEGKINLDYSVDKYIPWFRMKYEGREVKITIKHLLYEISGIPFETIGDIPPAGGDDALENSVRILMEKELGHKPGEKFVFASMNYNVLGLIIQKKSGEPFEKYMQDYVLKPLGLNDTCLSREDALRHGMAVGYKICFKKPRELNAPIYRGNTPAGYFATNAEDMSKWLRIQIGMDTSSSFPRALIEKSHKTELEGYGLPYAKGWFIYQGVQIFQAGNNPNFSSFIMADLEKKIGVAVLANMNSDYTEIIGRGILAVLQGKEPNESFKYFNDFNTYFDNVSVTIFFIVIFPLLLAIWLIAKSIKKIRKEKIKFVGIEIKGITAFIISSLLLVGAGYILSILPSLLGYNLSWKCVCVWLPTSFVISTILAFIAGSLFYIWFLIRVFYPMNQNG